MTWLINERAFLGGFISRKTPKMPGFPTHVSTTYNIKTLTTRREHDHPELRPQLLSYIYVPYLYCVFSLLGRLLHALYLSCSLSLSRKPLFPDSYTSKNTVSIYFHLPLSLPCRRCCCCHRHSGRIRRRRRRPCTHLLSTTRTYVYILQRVYDYNTYRSTYVRGTLPYLPSNVNYDRTLRLWRCLWLSWSLLI